jgi:hypothetical protein
MSDTPFLVRFGATVGVATLAALVAATPGAFRLSAAGDVDAVRAWLTLAGLLLLPMLALVPLARAARDGLRALTPSEGSRGLPIAQSASAALMVCTWLWILSIVGSVLRDKTHQRALGAVTLAVVALVTLAFLALVARRLVTLFVVLRQRRLAVGTLVTITATILSLVLLGARVARAAPDLTLGGRATLVDGLAIALTVAFAARKTFEDRRILARIGPPAAVCLFVVSMHTLVTSVPAMIAMEQACPVYFALLRGFARLT